MKNISIAGTVGRDAETRNAGDTTVTSWSVAVDHREGREKSTIWFDCSLWAKRGEALAPHITKGGKVAVSGDFSTREHNGKTYMQIRVTDVSLLGGKRDDGDRPMSARDAQAPSGYGAGGRPGAHVDEDEIPFAACVL